MTSQEARWIKASRSSSNGNCVEMRPTEGGVDVRDSKDPHGPILSFSKDEFAAWLEGAQAGEFDHLM